jgi:hypothetical protein
MTTLMDPVFAMDETFSSSRGGRLDQLRNALELTTITPRAHVRGRSFDRQSDLLPLLGRCLRTIGGDERPLPDQAPRLAALCPAFPWSPTFIVVQSFQAIHRRAELPGDDVAREVVQYRVEVKPAPADDLEIGDRPCRWYKNGRFFGAFCIPATARPMISHSPA